MDFNNKSIGIGNLTRIKRREKPAEVLKKLPTEENGEVAQLAVDVYETNDKLFIVAPLAGVDTEDVRVEITEDVVVIEGERQHPLPHEASEELLVQECYFGPFSRSIVLPEAVDSKRAKAEFKKNILILSIPKLDNIRTRVIKIEKTQGSFCKSASRVFSLLRFASLFLPRFLRVAYSKLLVKPWRL
ncbi:MAG: Hsp20/alpha crystallin family protein [Candidatus Gracilibacteria bacterium]|nr:Hsp20/alpha crystallin family protein [Candidatus Gracilibacteria bacterium]MDD5179309.1 Hsp20/alpha crystallin family protein [Candidatus Gracilibacteria bacterium]